MDSSKWNEVGRKVSTVLEIILKGLVKGIIGLVKAIIEAFR